jgi:hypothetical protein
MLCKSFSKVLKCLMSSLKALNSFYQVKSYSLRDNKRDIIHVYIKDKRKRRINIKRESFAQSINRHSMRKDYLELSWNMVKQKKWQLLRRNKYKKFDKTKWSNPKFVTFFFVNKRKFIHSNKLISQIIHHAKITTH